MTFLISGFQGVSLNSSFLANATADLPGLRLSVSGNAVTDGVRSFVYGSGTINNLMYYNLTYTLPGDVWEKVPEIVLQFEQLDLTSATGP